MNSQVEYSNIFKNEKCYLHPNSPFMFYCFDDKKFICNKCYKNHREHNIEIIDDLKEVAEQSGEYADKDFNTLLSHYTGFKEELMKIQKDLAIEISKLSDQIEMMRIKANSSNSVTPSGKGKLLFDMSYEEYDRIASLIKYNGKFDNFKAKINAASEKLDLSPYKNLRTLTKEVNILEYSPYREGYGPEVLIGKKEGMYYLSEGNTNHFIVFDLGKKVFIKSIQMTIHEFECTVKNFKISVKDNNEDQFKLVSSYECQPYWKTMAKQEFRVGVTGRIMRFDLEDNWGPGGGKFILIKRIFFNVGDLKE